MSEKNPEPGAGKKPQARYTVEFQKNAVRMVVEDGFSVEEAARAFECDQAALRKWVKKYRHRLGTGSQTSPEDKIEALQRENARLKMEREILLKAAAFFEKRSG